MYNEKIEKIVDSIHQEFGVRAMPVQLEEIVEKLGIRIKKAPSEEFSGLLLRKEGRALIGVNSNEPQVRQRFTIAHELGHYFLHKTQDAFIDYRDNESGIVRNSRERTANVFAATFLMPRSHVVADLKKTAKGGIFETEIERLAKKYDVSKEAMNYSILNLGLLN
jgi:Zn-dependent peptidase ImmA (M78 family)